MADKQITDLTLAGAISGADIFLVRLDGETEDKSASAGLIKTYMESDLSLTDSNIASGAAIALSKLATDPLARGNHTGTQALSTMADAGALAALDTVNNGYWAGSDLAVEHGGTGAGDASGAKTNLGFMTDLADDTSPELSGDLDTNGYALVSQSNASIAITPDGTGRTKVAALEAALPLNAQTGTSYTLVLSDAEKLVTMDNASPITLTVPENASVAFDTGSKINIVQTGAGQVTIEGDGAVTINAPETLKLRGQYSAATLIKTAADSWLLLGDLEESA